MKINTSITLLFFFTAFLVCPTQMALAGDLSCTRKLRITAGDCYWSLWSKIWAGVPTQPSLVPPCIAGGADATVTWNSVDSLTVEGGEDKNAAETECMTSAIPAQGTVRLTYYGYEYNAIWRESKALSCSCVAEELTAAPRNPALEAMTSPLEISVTSNVGAVSGLPTPRQGFGAPPFENAASVNSGR